MESTNSDSLNILYVEDDNDDQEWFLEALEEVCPNTQCFQAKSADEAWKLLQEADLSLDYIFLDINLPGMDGISFLKMLKQNKRLKSIPTIIYSTSSNEKYIRECRALGALSYIIKPNSFKEICDLLKGAVATIENAGEFV